MKDSLNIQSFLEEGESIPVADVRSPSEYIQGHIPGAISIPLFSDSERKEVGTIYKHSGREEAIFRGFEIVGAKYSLLLDEFILKAAEGKILLYCWRGGMRSGTLAWLLRKNGLYTRVLKGGYKSYRRFLRNFLSENFTFHILGGMTGSGKTGILSEMKKMGQQVIDLEAIACHKGSSFGALGEGKQPTTEQFENNLFSELSQMDRNRVIWLEDESPSIGKVFIPTELYSRMKASRLFSIEVPVSIRIDRLVGDYSRFDHGQLIQCMERIRKKIGGQHLSHAIKSLEENDYHTFAEIALNYYDKAYRFSLEKKAAADHIRISTDSGDPLVNARKIIHAAF